jgi:Protein of unknown function (DUF4238)
MTKRSKRHHYLPQFYLKGFTGEGGLLCIFDRKTNTFRKQQPLNTAHEREFYTTINNQGVKSDGIERMFSGLESVACNVISRLNTRRTAEWKDEQERVSFAIFIAYFYTRIPAFDREQTIFAEHMYRARMKADHLTEDAAARSLRQFAQATGEDVDAETIRAVHKMVRDDSYDVDVPRQLTIRLMIDTALHLAETLLTLDWTFVTAPADLAFITSDAPFVIAPPPGEDDYRACGLLTPGAASAITLSPRKCLVIEGEGGGESYCRIQKDGARRINENVATNSARFVIGRDQAYLERLVKRIRLDQYRWTSRFVCDTREIDGEIVFHAKRPLPQAE